MALNSDNIFRYNLKSKSNPKWNFQIQFLCGSDETVGEYDDLFLPDGILDEIKITQDLPDELPFGKQKAGLLELTINFTQMTGDFSVFKEWVLLGGQIISNVYYPNMWRVLSNNGRGASDFTYNIVEFWGCQDLLPEQKYVNEFGKIDQKTIQIFSIDNFMLNKFTDFSVLDLYKTERFLSIVEQFSFDNGTQKTSGYSRGNDLRTITASQLMQSFMYFFIPINSEYLRSWIIIEPDDLGGGTIDYVSNFLAHWDFNEQLTDGTTDEGDDLLSGDVSMIAKIYDSVVIGGLLSNKSKEGFYQFKNMSDLFSSLCEQFLSRLTFEYHISDLTAGSTRMLLRFALPLSNYRGGIFVKLENVTGERTLNVGYYNINQTTVSYKSYSNNQNKNTYQNYGSLKQDSYDNKSLFQTNVQIGNADDFFVQSGGLYQLFKLPYYMINQLYYAYDDDNMRLVHANCRVEVYESEYIQNENTSVDGLDFSNNTTTQRENLIVWSNKRYNKSGLSYVQSKAYSQILNNAKMFECETIDYIIRPRDLGIFFQYEMASNEDYPPSWFNPDNNNHILVSVEMDLLTGVSKCKVFVRGNNGA